MTHKLEVAIKHQEHLLKKMKQYSKAKDGNKNEMFSSTSKITKKQQKRDSDSTSEKTNTQILQKVDTTHCAIVLKSLFNLLLNVDHSCSADMFLLSCKVIARLVRMTNEELELKHFLSKEELIKLVHIFIKSELPWAPHALACLLQDTLDLGTNTKSEMEMETEISQSTTWNTAGKYSNLFCWIDYYFYVFTILMFY